MNAPTLKDSDFNSHAHVERDISDSSALHHSRDFNSHAHVERDLSIFGNSGISAISTHTLTWSVTAFRTAVNAGGQNFNSHAHVERDHFASGLTNEQLNFNSHAHVERDLCDLPYNSIYEISTHTLTWSVTQIITHSRIFR